MDGASPRAIDGREEQGEAVPEEGLEGSLTEKEQAHFSPGGATGPQDGDLRAAPND